MSPDSSIVSSIYARGEIYDCLYGGGSGYLHWLELAKRYGDPILEIMCGTGLLTIPLAQQGYQVTGIDLSEPMLVEGRRKAEVAGVSVEWRQGDARDFDLGKRFNFIFIPNNSICHLLTRTDLEACLGCVARHLHPQGRFAVSVFVPSLTMLTKAPDEIQHFSTYQDPLSGQEVVMTHTSWYDPATQIKYNNLYKQVGNGPVEPDGELTMRMYFPQELDALFWYNGFAIEEKYDGNDRPFDAQSTLQNYILKLR